MRGSMATAWNDVNPPRPRCGRRFREYCMQVTPATLRIKVLADPVQVANVPSQQAIQCAPATERRRRVGAL